MATIALPKFIVIKSHASPNDGNACYDKEGSVRLGEPSIFSTLVKIEAERATSNDKYVNLRFCSSNKYWQKNADDHFVVAKSNKVEEDTTKPSCTLFEAVKVDGGTLYLRHVQTGGRLSFKELAFYVEPNPSSTAGYLTFVDWDTLVKLPEHLAFKGDNGKYLKAYYDSHEYLKFATEDPNDVLSGNKVFLMPDGHVRIKNDNWGKFWRRSPNWIWADSTDITANNKDTLFWPVRIDEKTIALRNAGNNYFCKSLSVDGMSDCLNAAVSTITCEARLEVQELVNDRKLYNVRYKMEDARIFGETPYLAGTATATNNGDVEATITVEIKYENQSSFSFSNSLSITAGVSNSIKAGVPEIAEEEIKISYEISSAMEWGITTTKTTSVTATGGVPVPARSRAVVRYVGTMGTCDVPFTYTQQDKSSTDGKITETDMSDGVFTGVNCYNFDFVMEKPQSLVMSKDVAGFAGILKMGEKGKKLGIEMKLGKNGQSSDG